MHAVVTLPRKGFVMVSQDTLGSRTKYLKNTRGQRFSPHSWSPWVAPGEPEGGGPKGWKVCGQCFSFLSQEERGNLPAEWY